jgi:hypothetical protein
VTKQEFIEWAKSKGWIPDKYGHLQKELESGALLRFKIQANSVRYERKLKFTDGGSEWRRVRSGYFKDLSIGEDGKLRGLR